MSLFHVVDGASVVLRSKGVYRQSPLFQRDGNLAARWGGGFIMLRREGGTTLPHVSWDYVEGPAFVQEKGAIGACCLVQPLLSGQAAPTIAATPFTIADQTAKR